MCPDQRSAESPIVRLTGFSMRNRFDNLEAKIELEINTLKPKAVNGERKTMDK